jgi:hypothetical protein
MLECHIRNCKYHAPSGEGPFCHEIYCRNTLEVVKIWPDGTSCGEDEEMSHMSDDYVLACVNDDGGIPTYDEAVKR